MFKYVPKGQAYTLRLQFRKGQVSRSEIAAALTSALNSLKEDAD
jgi:hypothetical protein